MNTRSAGRRPNILFLFPDQHRFDWLGTNPRIPVRTPNLDRLARGGVRFSNAVCPSPLCAPSRACLASGREYDRCRVASNKVDYPLDQRTFYSLLRESGYHVAGCGKFDLHKATFDWGLDGKRLLEAWGFSDGIDNEGKWDAISSGAEEPKGPYMAYLHRGGLAAAHVQDFMRRRQIGGVVATFPTPLPEEAYCDNWVARNGLKLMERFPQDRPWFLQVNFTGPHTPLDITKRMEGLYRGIDFPQPNECLKLSPEQHVAIRQNYSAMVENIDRWVGIYLEELGERGELDNTLIVYSSDHGEMLWDHNLTGKSTPYQPSVGVPLIIAGPGVREGIVSDRPATTTDLTATFLDYARVPQPEDMDSLSLKSILEGRGGAPRDYVLSGLGSWRMVFDGRYKLVRGIAEGALLFDLECDPFEEDSIAETSPVEFARLSGILDREGQAA